MMEAQVLVKNAETTSIDLDRDRLYKRFKRALIVDDEIDYAHSVRENLEFLGYDAHVAGSLDAAAQKLHEENFPFIICDNIFVDRAKRRGSEFIRDHGDLFGDGKIILMTGFPEKQIVDADILKLRGVTIIKKGAGSIDQLKALCNQVVSDKVEEFKRRLSLVCDSIIDNVQDEKELETLFSDAYILKKGQSYLVNYLKKFPDQELTQFVIDGKGYSPRDLISELHKGSPVAKQLVDQLLDDALD